MKTFRQRIILGVLGVALLAVLVVTGKKRSQRTQQPASQPGEATTVKARTFSVDEWLASCLKPCRATAPRKLAHLTAEKRERYCTVNCECGLEKMTEAGPAPRTVLAPSKAWLSLSEDDQYRAAAECQKRSIAQSE